MHESDSKQHVLHALGELGCSNLLMSISKGQKLPQVVFQNLWQASKWQAASRESISSGPVQGFHESIYDALLALHDGRQVDYDNRCQKMRQHYVQNFPMVAFQQPATLVPELARLKMIADLRSPLDASRLWSAPGRDSRALLTDSFGAVEGILALHCSLLHIAHHPDSEWAELYRASCARQALRVDLAKSVLRNVVSTSPAIQLWGQYEWAHLLLLDGHSGRAVALMTSVVDQAHHATSKAGSDPRLKRLVVQGHLAVAGWRADTASASPEEIGTSFENARALALTDAADSAPEILLRYGIYLDKQLQVRF